jgi:glycosyltransferase involved in cell wall biosynthesis
MKEKPLCTIILPTIGRPKYFGAALASVAAQTYRPFNILVSDNAANPPIELAEIQKWAPEAIVRLVRRSTRLAGPHHINLCLQEADGEYVFIMSDDDLIVPGYVSAAMECMSSEPSVVAVVALQTAIDESFFGPVSNLPINFKTLLGNEFVTRWFNGENPGVWNLFPMLVRRRRVLECGGFPDYPTGSYGDITLFFQLCLGAKMGLLDGGYYYRVYPTSAGLAAPWRGLLMATNCYERDLLDLHKKGRLERKLLLAIIRSNTHLLIGRWKQLYRHRPGFENKACPLFDLALRTLSVSWRYGLGALPKLHKYVRRGMED